MISASKLPFPMWRLHYQLLGGHRRMGMIAVILIAVATMGTLGLVRIFRDLAPSTVCAYVLNTIGFIQIVVLLPGGCNAIYRAALRDFESKMIESHRLTPMTSFEVTLGYVFGATLQLLVITGVLAACGVVVSLFSDLPLAHWLIGHAVLLSAALPLWSMVAASGMRAAKPISPAPFLIAVMPFSAGILVLPGLGVLAGAYSVLIAYWVGTGSNTLANGPIAALVASNMFLAGYWIYIAATKYRRPDLPVLNGFRGLMLLFIWLVVAFGGVILGDTFVRLSRVADWGSDMPRFQWIASLITSIPVCAVIVMATSECRAVVAQGRPPRGIGDRFPDALYAILAALLVVAPAGFLGMIVPIRIMSGEDGGVSSLGTFLHDPGGRDAVIRVQVITALAFIFALLTVRGVFLFLFRKGRPRVKWPSVTTLGLLAAAWGAPPLFDVIRTEAAQGGGEVVRLSLFTTLSPGGVIGAAWSGVEGPMYAGLAIQAAVAVFMSHRGGTLIIEISPGFTAFLAFISAS